MRGFSEIQAPRQSRLAHLAGAQQGHRRGLAKALDQRAVEVTEKHFDLKIRNRFLKFKLNLGKKSEWSLPANHGLSHPLMVMWAASSGAMPSIFRAIFWGQAPLF
jgi:hypothetical protein